LSGCDTTSYLYGIGKATALKALNCGMMELLGQKDVNMKDVISEATEFISSCYGSRGNTHMSETRYAIWSTKMSKPKICSAPKLKSLPPTSDAFTQHVYRAHYQTMIWKSALSDSPPTAADPLLYGWTMKDSKLFPVLLPEDVSPAPVEVLQMIKCGCSSARPCSSGRCSCVLAQMSCSMFCTCHARADCNNGHTRCVTVDEE
jgi:hypothetical protein